MRRRPTLRTTPSSRRRGPGSALSSRLRAFCASRATRVLVVTLVAVLLAVLAAAVAPSTARAAPGARARPAVAAGTAHSAVRTGQCDLPDAQPLWIDYAEGSVSFRQSLFGRPGVIAATSGTIVSPALRAAGARTIYWEMKLGTFVGTTASPADPATIEQAAERLFKKAMTASACATPLIAINELNGPSTTTPWTVNNAQYRANVFLLLKSLQARGARPFLLIPGTIYTGGEAAAWWQQVAGVADLVREVYLNARTLSALGPLKAGRTIRTAFRSAIADLTEIGIPPGRIGLMLGLMSEPGFGGREGLQPANAWFDLIKIETLSARQVAVEVPISTLWSWGWGTFTAAGNDPDKPTAACVYLWTRDQSLCDAPGRVGPDFDTDLLDGQLQLPAGSECVLGPDAIATADIDALAKLTGDRDVAYTALFERLVERRADGDSPEADVLDAERAIILTRFRGIRRLYEEALGRAAIGVEQARAIIADVLRRARIQAALPVREPTLATIAEFYSANADVAVRLVEASPAASWLGGRTQGLALSSIAPLRVFQFATGIAEGMRTTAGRFSVRALGAAVPLGSLSLGAALPAIRDALMTYARADALEAWNAARQPAALDAASCLRDDLPPVGSVDLTLYLPYLRLN